MLWRCVGGVQINFLLLVNKRLSPFTKVHKCRDPDPHKTVPIISDDLEPFVREIIEAFDQRQEINLYSR
jgi:hypothetical protein